MKKTPAFLFFVSGHGYGHVSRMKHVIRKLEEKPNRNFHILLVSDANPDYVKSLHFKRTTHIVQTHDIGLVQSDSFTVNHSETIKKLSDLLINKNSIEEKIIKQIAGYDIMAVISDSSPTAFSIKEKLKVPGFFIGNFTWSDIYKDLAVLYKEYSEIVHKFDEMYLLADKCYILPMHTEMHPFLNEKKIDIPLIAPIPSSMTKLEFEKLIQKDLKNFDKIILFSFGGFDYNNLPVEYINSMNKKYLFISTHTKSTMPHPPNLVQIPLINKDYLGVIKHSDMVITKPGYGIIADCIISKKPVIYTERGRFAEYDVLKKWLDENFPSVYMSNADLLSGNWVKYIDQGLKLPQFNKEIPVNGAEFITNELLIM